MNKAKETLIRFSDIYLWDFFALTASGFLCTLDILFILFLFHDIKIFLQICGILNINFIIYLLVFYSLGLIVNCIFGFFYNISFYNFSKKMFRKGLFFRGKLSELKNKESAQVEKIKQILSKDKNLNQLTEIEDRDYIVITRHVLESEHIPHRYLSFYSKHGFYKNIAILSLINSIVLLFYFTLSIIRYSPNYGILIGSVVFILIQLFLYGESQKFWYYASDELYGKFLLTKF